MSFELTRKALVPELSIFGSPSTCSLRWQKCKIGIVNNRATLAEPSALFTESWSASHCKRVISIDLLRGTPRPTFLRRSGAKRQRHTLSTRSLNNKSAVFADPVCDVRADLFTICETWPKDKHSAVLSELTSPGYRTLAHCQRPGRKGGGTA